MMNGTAVLPASVATAFSGNAAAISAGNPKNSSGSGSTGGFSDTLGAMVTSGQQCGMNSATRMSTENTAVMTGEVLGELAELEQSAEELKELLKTAELASYMQGNTAQFFADVIQTDNSELTLILTGNDSTDINLQPVVADFVQNDADPTVMGLVSENIARDPQNDVILPESSGENDFADEIQISAGEITDNVVLTSDTTEITGNTVNDETVTVAMTDNSGLQASDLSDTDKTTSMTDTIRADGQEAIGVQSGDAEAVKTDAPEFKVTSYEKSADNTDNSVKLDIQTQDDSAQRIAFAKRNIESKSDELRAITKGNEVTKSDSDLDTDQKVTDKNAVNDMGAKGADVFARTESRTDESGQEAQTVRMPISDMASFVSEHAPKANGKSTMTVVLTPETLGKITVRMVNESGKLTVEILTETQAAKELLQARSEQLAYALRNDDVELTSYKVETSQAELFQRDFDGSSKNPYRQQSHDRQKNDTDDFDSLLGEIQAMG